MTVNIDSNYINQFSDIVHHLVEQKGSKIRSTVQVEMAKGEKHFFDRLGTFTASEVTSRLQLTDRQDADHSRRMATIARYHAGCTLDDIDKFKMLIDPASDYARKLASSHGRNFDDQILAAMVGTASTGKTGSGSQAFDTSNNQIAHGSAGFTVAKFNQALRILEANEVDVDGKLYCALGALAIEDLLGEGTYTSIDYQNRKPLSDGNMPDFRGVTLVRSQRVPHETTDTTYRALVYTPDTTKVAIAKDLEIKTAELHDHNYALAVDTYMMFGGVRMEESTIVDVLYQ